MTIGDQTIPAELVAVLIPLAILQIGLIVWALWDLTRPGRRVRGDSKILWALVILLVNLVGPILYLVAGRQEGEVEASEPPPPGPGAIAGWQAPPRPTATAPGGPPDASSPAAGAGPAAGTAGPSVVAEPTPPPPRRDRVRPDAPPAVSTRGLTKRYGGAGGGVLALDGLDLDVPTGSVFGLLGPNGAGKTTTLRMLTGLSIPTAGSATVAGVPLDGHGPAMTRHIGFLDQEPRYYGFLSGRELVTMAGRLHGLDGPELRARCGEVLERVGLATAADRRVGTYSGGMRQRLGIAQALVNRPDLVILDEPVASLDPEGRRDLLALIGELGESATVFFSTHVLSDVERICDRVAILDHGRLVTTGPLDELLDRYALPVYRIDAEPGQAEGIERLMTALRRQPWATDVRVEHDRIVLAVSDPTIAARELLPVIVAEGVALSGFERARPSLEDVFLRLVGRGTGEPPEDVR
jgi:ABC-2 type transport system ATP-binding protein